MYTKRRKERFCGSVWIFNAIRYKCIRFFKNIW